jgi:hypothetical protein
MKLLAYALLLHHYLRLCAAYIQAQNPVGQRRLGKSGKWKRRVIWLQEHLRICLMAGTTAIHSESACKTKNYRNPLLLWKMVTGADLAHRSVIMHAQVLKYREQHHLFWESPTATTK